MSSGNVSMISKAAWLIEEGRVVRISEVMYYVMGRKNRHIVRVEGSTFSCTCPGFRERRVCSHVIAVSALIKLKDKRELFDEATRERVEKELKLFNKKKFIR